MIHRCSDGGEGKLKRDPSTPVGELGPVFCTRCDWTSHGQKILDDFKALIPTIKSALR